MANDLSKIIQDTIVSILNTNISKDIIISEILLSSKQSLENKNLAIIKSDFNFDNLKSQITFIYPSYIASFIFNCIVQEDSELLLEINDDIKDSIKEINAQVVSALELAFNNENYEDLGKCTSSVGDIELKDSNTYEPSDNFIVLKLKIEDKDFEIYIDFDDEILTNISEFTSLNKEILNDNDDNTNEDNIENDNKDDNTNEDNIENDNKKSDQNNENNQDTSNDDVINTKEEDDNNSSDDKKDKKLKLLIIIISSLLLIIIIAIAVMFFTGMFDQEVIPNDTNKTKVSKRDLLLNVKNKDITYNSNMVNVKKLNKRLALLTKYEILEDDILEKYKLEEKERLYKIKMQKLEEFALMNKEESLFKNDIKRAKLTNRFNQDNKSDINTSSNIINNEILTFIEITANSYRKYKDTINKEKTKTTLISICKNNNKTKVYIGPLYIKQLINNLMSKVSKKDAKLISISRKEFNKRCDF